MTAIWKKLGTPVKIGLSFAALGMALVIVGIFRGNVPLHPANMAVALLIAEFARARVALQGWLSASQAGAQSSSLLSR